MRACVNTNCTAFAHVVYSVATRCPLCKWDLQFIRPASESPAVREADRRISADH